MVITCEHGGNKIPAKYRPLFANAEDVLNSHRGYDPGTLELSRRIAKALSGTLFCSTTSRLLIELNRTPGHPQVFSHWTRTLPAAEQQLLIEQYYKPYRSKVLDHIASQLATNHPGLGRVIHLSVHSFTGVLRGKTRRTDIGLLFDPSRPAESEFCREWRKTIKLCCSGRAVHFNLPYRGTSDGLTTALRNQFSESRYLGIELEVNQKFVLGEVPQWRELQRGLAKSLRDMLQRAY